MAMGDDRARTEPPLWTATVAWRLEMAAYEVHAHDLPPRELAAMSKADRLAARAELYEPADDGGHRLR